MEPDWKLLLMRILNCFGYMHDDWYEQYWAKFGVTREEGRKIVEEYENTNKKKPNKHKNETERAK